MNFALTAESVGVVHDAHILFAIVARAQIVHTFLYFAHTGGAEAVSATGVLHRYAVIEGDVEDRFAFGCFNLGDLAVLLDKGDCWH